MPASVNCIGLLSVLFLTACGTSPNASNAKSDAPTAIDVEKSAAMNDYAKCVQGRARAVDDGFSDASLIALAVQQDCKDQFARYVKISAIGMNADALAAYSEKLESSQAQLTTEIVQKMRAQHQDN